MVAIGVGSRLRRGGRSTTVSVPRGPTAAAVRRRACHSGCLGVVVLLMMALLRSSTHVVLRRGFCVRRASAFARARGFAETGSARGRRVFGLHGLGGRRRRRTARVHQSRSVDRRRKVHHALLPHLRRTRTRRKTDLLSRILVVKETGVAESGQVLVVLDLGILGILVDWLYLDRLERGVLVRVVLVRVEQLVLITGGEVELLITGVEVELLIAEALCCFRCFRFGLAGFFSRLRQRWHSFFCGRELGREEGGRREEVLTPGKLRGSSGFGGRRLRGVGSRMIPGLSVGVEYFCVV
mmetsp:Transcript_13249/g.32347  ORF Transcript_13249/g.32347 Transcript_13249/m.32347 type:complete len:296 (-) Transcript_13249:1390-2277(-)